MPLRLFRRREQGKGTKETGEKCQGNREKGRTFRIGSERGNNQQRPLLISAAGGDEVGSVRCVPSFILMEQSSEVCSARCGLHDSDSGVDVRLDKGCQDNAGQT